MACTWVDCAHSAPCGVPRLRSDDLEGSSEENGFKKSPIWAYSYIAIVDIRPSQN